MEKNPISYRYSQRRIAQEGRKAMKISYKIWLDHHGKAFGDGPYELLRRVDRTKSLRQAANQMGMAYSKAWRLIRTLEERLGFPLLERKAGGASGGGSRITPKAKELMKLYGRFRKDVKDCMERIYRRHFSPMAKKAQK
jgi:molybdate transport system regulatory protein